MYIVPGILEKEWSEIEKKIEIVKPFTDTIQIDIIDGKFAPNATFLDPKPFAKYSKDLLLEVHLMVDNPISYLKPFAAAGFKRFLGHVEKMPNQAEFVAEGQLLGEVGLAIDGKTPLDAIKVPYEDLDMVLVMTINAGYSGQKLMPELLEKVMQVRKLNILNGEGVPLPIEVDGGINDQTIKTAKDSGASCFAVTSYLFNSENPKSQYQKLLGLVSL